MSVMFSNWSRRSARVPSAGFGYENGQLIAVARAISDCTWSSYLADVAIVPARQGQGYGQQLMLAIREQLLPFGKIFIYAVADKITFLSALWLCHVDYRHGLRQRGRHAENAGSRAISVSPES